MSELEQIAVEDEGELRERCRRLLVERAHLEETVQVTGLFLQEARAVARQYLDAFTRKHLSEKYPWLKEAHE